MRPPPQGLWLAHRPGSVTCQASQTAIPRGPALGGRALGGREGACQPRLVLLGGGPGSKHAQPSGQDPQRGGPCAEKGARRISRAGYSLQAASPARPPRGSPPSLPRLQGLGCGLPPFSIFSEPTAMGSVVSLGPSPLWTQESIQVREGWDWA